MHENDFLNDFKAKGCIAEVLTVLKTPISIYVFLSYVIYRCCHMTYFSIFVHGKSVAGAKLPYDI